MALISLFRKLSGLVRGGPLVKSRQSSIKSADMVKSLSEDLPAGDRVSKKRDWISAKYKK